METRIIEKFMDLSLKKFIPGDNEKCAFTKVQILVDKHNAHIKDSNLDSKLLLEYLEENHFDDFFMLVLYCFGVLEKKIYICYKKV